MADISTQHFIGLCGSDIAEFRRHQDRCTECSSVADSGFEFADALEEVQE
jgi:hypothetical protein